MVAAIIFLIVLLSYLTAGLLLARRILYPRVPTYAQVFQQEVAQGIWTKEQFDLWNQEAVSITSPFGYPLYGLYLPYSNSQRTVLLVHGFAHNLYGMLKYAAIFRQMGFNLLLIDQRYHGESGGPNSTLGFYEKSDLQAWYQWARQRQGARGIIGCLGESMGAAVVLQFATIQPDLAFAIADCSFSNFQDLLVVLLKKRWPLPAAPVLAIVRWWVRVLSGASLEDINPRSAVEKTSIPLLFIHGEQDRYVPCRMSEELFAAKLRGPSRLFTMPAARHAGSFLTNPPEYTLLVRSFLTENGLISAAETEAGNFP